MNVVHVGFVGSYVIVSFTCVVQFPAVSLYLTYTYLNHSAVVHHAHAWFVILKLLLVAYASAVVHVLLSQLNCICVTPLGSLDDNANVNVAQLAYVAHALILIVFDVGAVLSIQLTVAVLLHVFPAVSVKLNTYEPFAVNVYTFVHAGC